MGVQIKTENISDCRQHSGIRLLVVDDDTDVLKVVAGQLEAAGYYVVTAPTGAAALALFDADISLIISDLAMPGMDGVHLIQQARRRRPRVPAILTGLADNGAESALRHVIGGPVAVLCKPINSEQLADRVAKLLDNSKCHEPDLLA